MNALHVNLSEWIYFSNIFLYLCELKCKDSLEVSLQQHAAENQFVRYLSSSLRK